MNETLISNQLTYGLDSIQLHAIVCDFREVKVTESRVITTITVLKWDRASSCSSWLRQANPLILWVSLFTRDALLVKIPLIVNNLIFVHIHDPVVYDSTSIEIIVLLLPRQITVSMLTLTCFELLILNQTLLFAINFVMTTLFLLFGLFIWVIRWVWVLSLIGFVDQTFISIHWF